MYYKKRLFRFLPHQRCKEFLVYQNKKSLLTFGQAEYSYIKAENNESV